MTLVRYLYCELPMITMKLSNGYWDYTRRIYISNQMFLEPKMNPATKENMESEIDGIKAVSSKNKSFQARYKKIGRWYTYSYWPIYEEDLCPSDTFGTSETVESEINTNI